MRTLLKRVVPLWLLKLHRNRTAAKFRNLHTEEVFSKIYKSNHWKSSESISGAGSEIKQTETLISNLNRLLNDYSIKSVLDLPCGDFRWMQKVDLANVDYIGADIVEDLIKSNVQRYKESPKLTFKVLNLITDPLPKCDLIIVRDCLVHLSYADIAKALQNIKTSGSKYLLTTTFTDCQLNHDIVTGGWRPLNLCKSPMNLSAPVLIINENCTEGNGEFKDKSMGLWVISTL